MVLTSTFHACTNSIFRVARAAEAESEAGGRTGWPVFNCVCAETKLRSRVSSASRKQKCRQSIAERRNMPVPGPADEPSAASADNVRRLLCALQWAEQYAGLDLDSERCGDADADTLSYVGELLRNGVVLSRLAAARLQQHGDRGLRWHANSRTACPQLGPTTRSIALSDGSHNWTAAAQLPGTHPCPTTAAQARHNLELVLRELRRDRRVVAACAPRVVTGDESSCGRGSPPEGADFDLAKTVLT